MPIHLIMSLPHYIIPTRRNGLPRRSRKQHPNLLPASLLLVAIIILYLILSHATAN